MNEGDGVRRLAGVVDPRKEDPAQIVDILRDAGLDPEVYRSGGGLHRLYVPRVQYWRAQVALRRARNREPQRRTRRRPQ